MSQAELGRQLYLERAEIRDYLASLSDEQWHRPSSCSGWNVIEVAAHLAGFLSVSVVGLARRMARAGFSPERANARDVTTWTNRGAPAILWALSDEQPLGVAEVYRTVGLTEAVIHHQDMRRPFGERRAIPEIRLRTALSVITRRPGTGTGALRRRRGLRLTATDIDWSTGSGAVVTGPGEAILMALAGRTGALHELSGDGKALLAEHFA